MWVPAKVVDWFQISKDTVDSLREDLAAVRAERDGLKGQLASTQANFEWLRVKVNGLEVERAALLEKAYGVKIAVPEVLRTPNSIDQMMNQLTFDDIGDDMAKKLGLPVYGS